MYQYTVPYTTIFFPEVPILPENSTNGKIDTAYPLAAIKCQKSRAGQSLICHSQTSTGRFTFGAVIVLALHGCAFYTLKQNHVNAATVPSRCLRKPAATSGISPTSAQEYDMGRAGLLHILYIQQGQSSFSFGSVRRLFSNLHVEIFPGLYRLQRLLQTLKRM